MRATHARPAPGSGFRTLPEKRSGAALGKNRDNDQQSESLSDLKNRHLAAVTFVRDYVQLDFDGPRFTSFLYPILNAESGLFSISELGYRDALCGQISKKVIDAYKVRGEKLVIQFEDHAALEISLRERDQVGPEAAMLVDSKKRTSVWRYFEG